mgnify:CR=1 FL=1
MCERSGEAASSVVARYYEVEKGENHEMVEGMSSIDGAAGKRGERRTQRALNLGEGQNPRAVRERQESLIHAQSSRTRLHVVAMLSWCGGGRGGRHQKC